MCCRSVSCCTTVPMLHCCFLSLLGFCLVESVYKTALSCSVIVHISRNPYSRKQSHNLGHIKYLGFYKQTWDGQNSDEPNAQCFIFFRRVYSLQREIHDVPEGKRLRQLQVSDAVKRVLGMPNGPVRYPVKKSSLCVPSSSTLLTLSMWYFSVSSWPRSLWRNWDSRTLKGLLQSKQMEILTFDNLLRKDGVAQMWEVP